MILLLTDSDVFAGTERHVLDLATALCAGGTEAAIGCPADTPLARRADDAGLRHLAVEKRGAVDREAARQLSRLLRSGAVDLIHAHNGRTALAAAMARGRAGRGAVVFTQHFITPSRVTRRGVKRLASQWMHHWMSRRIDATIAISHAVRDAAVQRGDGPADRLTVVHNGIADPAAEARRDAAAVRDELGLRRDAPLVACAARLQPEKDVATLIDAMARVARTMPGAQCVVAGRGVQEAALRARIAAAGVGECVRLVGFREDVRDIMAAADVFALPAVAEPFGLVLLEAMALGRPVVATRAGGPLDIVEPGVTGALVEPGDARAMAEALRDLLADDAKRQRMGQAGRARYEACFTAERMAEATMAVYRRVLESIEPGKAGAACASVPPSLL